MTLSLYNNNTLQSEQGRVYYYDNVKFVMIFCVVLGHFISPLTSRSVFCSLVWSLANTFHMPVFIFISGFFAKRYIAADRSIRVQRTATYIILFLFAQTALSLFEILFTKKIPMPSLVFAQPSLWFLSCLVIWHLILPFFARFKWWIVIPVAVLMALYIGYEDKCTSLLSLSRVFVHFPFFLFGYFCSQKTVDKLFSWEVRGVLLLMSGVIAYIYLVFALPGLAKLLNSSYSYSQIEFAANMAFPLRWLSRLGFYVSALILSATVMSLIPRGKVMYTSLGAKSLSVYICHRFLYLAEVQYNWADYFRSTTGIAALFAISLAVTVLFSLKPFTIPFDLLQRISIRPLLRGEKLSNRDAKKV